MYANVIDTGVEQNERTFFLSTLFQWVKIVTAFKCTFEETMPKLSVNFENHISQDSRKNQYADPVCPVITVPAYIDRNILITHWFIDWFPIFDNIIRYR